MVAYLEHDLNHVLCPFVQSALMQHVSQPLKDGVDSTRGHLTQLLAHLLEKGDGHLCTVVSGVLQQQSQYLQGQDFMSNLNMTMQDRY